eukprot:5707104-Ditylum_brightwellii.AAC.1
MFGKQLQEEFERTLEYGLQKYVMEAVSCVELMFGCLTKHDTPMVVGNHPELDDTKNGTEVHLEIDLSRKLKEQYPDAEE